jgi:hypothetical protein
MMEGSGSESGSVLLTNESGSGTGRSENFGSFGFGILHILEDNFSWKVLKYVKTLLPHHR